MKKKLSKSWRRVVIIAVIILVIWAILSVFISTPGELYRDACRSLKKTLEMNETEFPITYCYPDENIVDMILVTGDSVQVERIFDVPNKGFYPETRYDYYMDGKIVHYDSITKEKTVRDGEYERTAQQIREERNNILERVYALLQSDVSRERELFTYKFEGVVHNRLLKLTFDRAEMDAAGFSEFEETMYLQKFYSPCWEVGVAYRDSGIHVDVPVPNKGKYSGDKMFPEIPDSFQGYTVIE